MLSGGVGVAVRSSQQNLDFENSWKIVISNYLLDIGNPGFSEIPRDVEIPDR